MLPVVLPGLREGAAVHRASHLDHLQHAEVEVALGGLRHVGQASRAGGGLPLAERAPVQRDGATERGQQAQQRAQQRGLPAAVGAQQAGDLAPSIARSNARPMVTPGNP
jgi:hypothetical protein